MVYFIFLFKTIFIVFITATLLIASTLALGFVGFAAVLVFLRLLFGMIFKDAFYWITRSKRLKKFHFKKA